MTQEPASFIPALRYRPLTRFYDRVLATTLKEEKLKSLLVVQAALAPGQHVLDLGCGTGTLSVLLARAQPEATHLALDADPEALSIARRKAERDGVEVEFHQSLAWEAPFANASLDRVVSSLFFHHLKHDDKLRTLRRVRDWLRPGGELHVADWGRAQDPLMRLAFLPVQVLDGFETTTDSVRGRLVAMMRESGFEEVTETRRERTLLGTLSLYRAIRPTA